jgi:4-amino-4-deoxy-L-arabinose transferase-like glycosyltransferase
VYTVITRILARPWLYFFAILAFYGILLVPTVQRQGISWDEQTDIWVARAYLKQPDGWLAGSLIDPSQTRLPAFTVALGYKLIHNTGLILARYISCLVGALTLVAVYIYCTRRYDAQRGLLAIALLATSPFFLSFARVAFTETDIYLACTLTWLIVLVDQFQERPSIFRAVLVGVMTGLSISAKFTAVVVFLPVWLAAWQSERYVQEKGLHSQKHLKMIFWLVVVFACVFAGWYLTNTLPHATYQGALRLSHYLLILAVWLLALIWSFRQRQVTSSWYMLGLFITGMAMLTFMVVPPEHLTNPAILRGLVDRFKREMTYQVGFMVEAGALHILTILFKSSLVIGIGLLVSLFLETFQWRNWKIRFPILVVWLYLGCLIILPLAQTFYTIPILPLLAIFAADQFHSLASRRRIIAMGLAVLAVLMLFLDLVLCYPDYNLNGYQWLGKSILAGRSSIGYRSVIQTPSDGVEQVMEWLNENARPGECVQAYLLSWHIVQAVAPSPAYKLENGLRGPVSANPDYVVVEINAQIRQSWWIKSSPDEVFLPPYDPNWLTFNYGKVYTVKRAFGIEMASVYRRK